MFLHFLKHLDYMLQNMNKHACFLTLTYILNGKNRLHDFDETVKNV